VPSVYIYIYIKEKIVTLPLRGTSGGPLLIQETEEVVGILVMVNTGTHAKYNLALKIDEVSSLLGNIDLLQ
ncbi:MAG: hypothetical protein AAFN93_26035, partial [Bacteroidota bacterium]